MGYLRSNLNLSSNLTYDPCNQTYFYQNKPPITEIHLINFNFQPIKINFN